MIVSRTPFRISFAGGGTDVKDFWKEETGAVLSAGISKFMYVIVSRRFGDGYRICYSEVEEVEQIKDVKNRMARECLRYLKVPSADIASFADIPAATGLGSSSAYLVGLLHALSYSRSSYINRAELAKAASEIEIEKLGERIGKQDHYSAAYGGLNLIEFRTDGVVEVKPVLCSMGTINELNQSLMLFYLGKRTKRSGDIIASYDFISSSDTLREMRDLAYEMKEALEKEQTLSDFGLLLGESWKLKKSLSPQISSREIDEVYQTALKAGALSGKLCGGGQNGFLLLFCEKQNKNKVRENLFPLREVPFRLDPVGSQIVYKD